MHRPCVNSRCSTANFRPTARKLTSWLLRPAKRTQTIQTSKALGILNYRRAYYPQSAELLKEAAAKRKDDPEVLYYLGEVYHQLKEYPDCKGALERALTLNLSPGLADDAKRALAECSETDPL